MSASAQIWTIGHWHDPIADFLARLRRHDIDLVADVRAHPGSRRSPHYGRDTLPHLLDEAGIGYQHLPALGGRRRRQQEVDPTINAGWDNPSFKNYADYTHTDAYENGIESLTGLAADHRVAVMCGEPVPWRCHRLLIGNTLTARGWTVWDILPDGAAARHELGRWGVVPVAGAGGRLVYPANSE